MGDIIIIVILIVLICVAISSSIKHFKGQGSCCGGGSYKPQKKKLEHIIFKKVFRVEGMHCDNCGNRVMSDINDIPGVSAIVQWKKGLVNVAYAKEVEDAVIIEKIEKAGYKVRKL